MEKKFYMEIVWQQLPLTMFQPIYKREELAGMLCLGLPTGCH